MTVDVTREEFEARVGVLEREVEGEKVVTRYILEQTRNGDDLAAVKSRLDRVEARLDRVETRLDRVEQKVDALGSELSGLRGAFVELRRELPKIVAETVREVLRERDGGRKPAFKAAAAACRRSCPAPRSAIRTDSSSDQL